MIDIYNYHSIVYNSFDNRLYASSFDLLAIVIYDLNLNLIDSLSTLSYEPWSLNCLNNQFYVGTQDGQILVFQDKTLIQQFQACNNLSSNILFIILL